MVWRWTQYSFTKGRNNLSFPLLCFPQQHFLPQQLNNSKSRVLKATSLSIPFPTQLRGLLRSPPQECVRQGVVQENHLRLAQVATYYLKSKKGMFAAAINLAEFTPGFILYKLCQRIQTWERTEFFLFCCERQELHRVKIQNLIQPCLINIENLAPGSLKSKSLYQCNLASN